MTLIQRFIQEVRALGFLGDMESSLGHRVAYASDNSPYFIAPDLVVYPKNEKDITCVLTCLAYPEFRSFSITMRGGGTGTNGQSLNSGVICDVTRYMNRILSIDLTTETIRVQPGVVLDELNTELAKHGYFFPPSVSPSNRATIGGMINTDAAGKGSKIYGKTSDYVKSLHCLSFSGQPFNSKTSSLSSLEGISDVLAECRIPDISNMIKTVYKDQPRFLTGYNLKPFLSENNDITPLLCGSEGTLAIVTEAELSIKKKPLFNALLVVSVSSIISFLEHISYLERYNAIAIELLDDRLINRAAESGLTPWECDVLGLKYSPKGVFYIEFSGDSLEDVLERSHACHVYLEACNEVLYGRVVSDSEDIKRCWVVRKNAVGTLSQPGMYKRPVSGMEDIVVPVGALPTVVLKINDLMTSFNKEYGLYGHVDVGCLHLRPLFDLRDTKEVEIYQTLCDSLFDIVKSVGGIFWGEHSKGLRNEYMLFHFPEPLIQLMQDIKACLDPDHRLNPWKIVSPSPYPFQPLQLSEHLFQATREVGVEESSVFYCNGNGQCQSVSRSDIMCPTSKPKRDQVHSPRGRALALKEWALNKETMSSGDIDSIKSVLDGCISCKACKTKCPVHVDISAHKSVFNADYFKYKKRPFKHYVLHYAEHMLPVIALVPFYKQIGALFGFRNLPSVKPFQLKRWCKKHGVAFVKQKTQGDDVVILIQDFFTTFVEPTIFQDTVNVLRSLGKRVFVFPFKPSGKASHLLGYTNHFSKKAMQWVSDLETFSSVSIIGIEPSTTLMFRDEYRESTGKDVGVKLLNEYLATIEWSSYKKPKKDYVLIQHCHEQALLSSQRGWIDVFEKFGQTLHIVSSPCCGMAGFFGLEKENVETSKEIYESAFKTHINQWPDAEVLLTGASCRSQVERFEQRSLRHPVQVLAELL